MGFLVGQSAVILPVPDAEPIVGAWRERFDSSTAAGVPAHLTVVYPFLPAAALTSAVVGELREIVAAHPAMSITFANCGHFPGVLYLAPSPDEPVRALIHSVVGRWPEAPPYRGEFGDPVPHLTVAVGAYDDDVEAAVSSALPFMTTIGEAALITFVGNRWTVVERLPLDPDAVAG